MDDIYIVNPGGILATQQPRWQHPDIVKSIQHLKGTDYYQIRCLEYEEYISTLKTYSISVGLQTSLIDLHGFEKLQAGGIELIDGKNCKLEKRSHEFFAGNYQNKCFCCGKIFNYTDKLWSLCKECCDEIIFTVLKEEEKKDKIPFELMKFPGDKGSSIHSVDDEEELEWLLRTAMDTGIVSGYITKACQDWLKRAGISLDGEELKMACVVFSAGMTFAKTNYSRSQRPDTSIQASDAVEFYEWVLKSNWRLNPYSGENIFRTVQEIQSKKFIGEGITIQQLYALFNPSAKHLYTFEQIEYLLSKFICEHAPQHSTIESPAMYVRRNILEAEQKHSASYSESKHKESFRLQQKYADNGALTGYELIDLKTGEVVWSQQQE